MRHADPSATIRRSLSGSARLALGAVAVSLATSALTGCSALSGSGAGEAQMFCVSGSNEDVSPLAVAKVAVDGDAIKISAWSVGDGELEGDSLGLTIAALSGAAQSDGLPRAEFGVELAGGVTGVTAASSASGAGPATVMANDAAHVEASFPIAGDETGLVVPAEFLEEQTFLELYVGGYRCSSGLADESSALSDDVSFPADADLVCTTKTARTTWTPNPLQAKAGLADGNLEFEVDFPDGIPAEEFTVGANSAFDDARFTVGGDREPEDGTVAIESSDAEVVKGAITPNDPALLQGPVQVSVSMGSGDSITSCGIPFGPIK